MYHLPGYNYCGPGTDLKTAGLPINKLDAICKQHDMDYADWDISTEEADRRMVERLEELEESESIPQKLLVKYIMYAKAMIQEKTKLDPNAYFRGMPPAGVKRRNDDAAEGGAGGNGPAAQMPRMQEVGGSAGSAPSPTQNEEPGEQDYIVHDMMCTRTWFMFINARLDRNLLVNVENKDVTFENGWNWIPYMDTRLSMKGSDYDQLLNAEAIKLDYQGFSVLRIEPRIEHVKTLSDGGLQKETLDDDSVYVMYHKVNTNEVPPQNIPLPLDLMQNFTRPELPFTDPTAFLPVWNYKFVTDEPAEWQNTSCSVLFDPLNKRGTRELLKGDTFGGGTPCSNTWMRRKLAQLGSYQNNAHTYQMLHYNDTPLHTFEQGRPPHNKPNIPLQKELQNQNTPCTLFTAFGDPTKGNTYERHIMKVSQKYTSQGTLIPTIVKIKIEFTSKWQYKVHRGHLGQYGRKKTTSAVPWVPSTPAANFDYEADVLDQDKLLMPTDQPHNVSYESGTTSALCA